MQMRAIDVPQGQSAHPLRALCKQRLLEGTVRRISSHAVTQASGNRRIDAETGKQPFLVLIADAPTLQTMQGVCQIHHLFEEGVRLIECIESARQALPKLEAVYFISPSDDNIQYLIKDLTEKGPKYKGFHIFFSHRLSDTQLQHFAQCPDAVVRVKSFAELNLSFRVYDDRTFHFDDHKSLAMILSQVPPESKFLEECACRLSTLFISMASSPRILFAGSQQADGQQNVGGVCERLAHELQARLCEVQDKSSRETPILKDLCTLLIVDRSFDWVPLLLHDLHYEACAHDLLASSSQELADGKLACTDQSGGAQKLSMIGQEADALWESYRHLPLWEVMDDVDRKVKEWARKNEDIRARDEAADSSTVARNAHSTLAALEALPQHQQNFKKLQVHVDICSQCNQVADSSNIVDVCALEQRLATGIDETGTRLRPASTEEQLLAFLRDPAIDGQLKTRMLLLYFTTESGMKCEKTKRAHLAMHLPRADQQLVLSPKWAATQQATVREQSAHRKSQAKGKAGNAKKNDSSWLRRWVPRVQELIPALATGSLNAGDIRELRSPANQTAHPGAKAPARKVVIFIIGGVSLPEVRAVHEAARTCGVDAFVGGSCMLTPNSLLDVLRSL